MDSNRKKELINSLANDDNSFTEIMSRKEKRKKAKQKKFEDQLIKELEKNKRKRMKKEQKEREKQKANEIHPEIKRLEDTMKLQQQQMNEIKKDLEDTKRLSLQQSATTDHQKPTSKKGWGNFSKFYLCLIFLLVAGFLGYSIYDSFHQIDQLFIIINSSLISAFAIFFILTSLITKDSAKKKMTIFTTFILVAFIGFHIAVKTNILILPQQAYIQDFSNQTIAKVITWASDNKIKLNYEYDYSDNVKTNKIISQNVEPNTLVKDIDYLNVVVSEGPNYDMLVNVPDMIGWNIDEVVSIIKKNKLNNVLINYEFSEEMRDNAIEQSRSGEMKRSDELAMKFSLGREEDLEPVKMKDLTNMEEFDATLWLKRNGIKYEIVYQFSDEVTKGRVISTDPKEGVMINQKEMSVTLTISKGKKLKAPDFTKMSIEEISKWADKNKINVLFNSEYDDSVKAGKVKRASVKAGDTIEEGQTIYIITSKGPLKMIQFGTGDLEKIKSFALQHNISVNITEQFSDVPTGQIISTSVKPGDYLIEGQGIEVVVSKGKAVQVPNFVGMTSSAAQNTCKSAGISCKLNYAYSSQAKGTIIHQDTNAGAQIVNGATVVLTVSNGPKPNGGSSNNSSNNSGNNSNSGNNNSGNTNPPTPVCHTYKFILGGAGSTGNQTYNMIKNTGNNKYLNIIPNYVDSCPNGNTTNGAICSSSVASGSNVTTCDTITITIVNK